MTKEQLRELRIQVIKKNCEPFAINGYLAEGAVTEAKRVLGERATYLKSIEDLSDEDIEILWNYVTVYSTTRNNILELLADAECSANKEGYLWKAAELRRLARAIDYNT